MALRTARTLDRFLFVPTEADVQEYPDCGKREGRVYIVRPNSSVVYANPVWLNRDAQVRVSQNPPEITEEQFQQIVSPGMGYGVLTGVID
jgi:hypothetical protein